MRGQSLSAVCEHLALLYAGCTLATAACMRRCHPLHRQRAGPVRPALRARPAHRPDPAMGRAAPRPLGHLGGRGAGWCDEAVWGCHSPHAMAMASCMACRTDGRMASTSPKRRLPCSMAGAPHGALHAHSACLFDSWQAHRHAVHHPHTPLQAVELPAMLERRPWHAAVGIPRQIQNASRLPSLSLACLL